jgi:glycerate 2-kinase
MACCRATCFAGQWQRKAIAGLWISGDLTHWLFYVEAIFAVTDSPVPVFSDDIAFSLLRAQFDAGVARAQPEHVVPPALKEVLSQPGPWHGTKTGPRTGRLMVVGAGKASAAMACAVELALPDLARATVAGLVVTRYGHAVPCDRIEIVEAAHPVPDQAGHDAARRIIELVHPLGADDTVIALISGGGSALLTLPCEGLGLADKQLINDALLRSGAPIDEMNCVRKHLSAIKGGQLARAVYPARLVTLAISDVPGDDPSVIASGPTVPDPTTQAQARAILEKYRIDLTPAAAARLNDPAHETPKAGDAIFEHAEYRLVAAPMASLEAAAQLAWSQGLEPIILGDALEGEARELGRAHADEALKRLGRGRDRPIVLLSGGETTVTVSGKPGAAGAMPSIFWPLHWRVGGRAAFMPLPATPMASTGPRTMPERSAGPYTLKAMRDELIDPWRCLTGHDAYTAFEAVVGLVVTGRH